MAGEVDGFREDLGGFLWGVEAHRVFGGDEIKSPLGLPLQFECGFEFFLGDPSFFGSDNGIELIHESLAAALQQLIVAILNHIDARFDFFLREVMACLTGAIDVEQWAANPVVGYLRGPVPLIWHVAIGAGDTGPGMNPLAPEFELGMLRLQDFRARFCVLVVIKPFAIGEFTFVPVLFDLIRAEPLAPGNSSGSLLEQ